MVASKYGNPLTIFNLEDKNVEESFDTIEASINIVSHKQIISILPYKKIVTGNFPQILKISRRSKNCP
jgi:hypothetical protein